VKYLQPAIVSWNVVLILLTDGRTFETHFITSIQKSRPKNQELSQPVGILTKTAKNRTTKHQPTISRGF